jgi:hypothetical protein
VPRGEGGARADEQPEDEDGQVPEATIPLSVRRSLRDVLGGEGEQVEQVWLDALASDSERIRVDAAKVLTQAAVQLSRDGEGDSARLLIPKSVEDVELLTLSECYAALAAIYVTEMDVYSKQHGEEEAVRLLREHHPDLEIPLALLRRVVSVG